MNIPPRKKTVSIKITFHPIIDDQDGEEGWVASCSTQSTLLDKYQVQEVERCVAKWMAGIKNNWSAGEPK